MKSVIGAATAAALAAIGLSGCGTITQGTTQDIAIVSSPPGGRCDLDRNGEHIATVYRTPATVNVDKTRSDIMLTCTKPGFQKASLDLESGYGIGVFGNLIVGGAVGWGIDVATGAENKYPSTANVQFHPMDPATVSAMQLTRSLCTEEDRELARQTERTTPPSG